MSRQTLGEACSRLSSGKSIPSNKVLDKGLYPVIGGNGRRGFTNSYNFEGRCAVIGRQGAACGNVHYFSGKAYMTEHAVVACAANGNDSHYLAYLLSTMNLGRLSGQSAQPGLSVRTLSKQFIDLPSLKKQRQVVELLGSLDEKIEVNARANGYLLQLTKLQLKDYLSQAVDTPLVSVGDYVGSMSNGATPSRKNAAFWDDGNIPWVKTGEVNNGLILKTEEHVTRLALEKTSIKLLPVDTVIMALYGSGTAGRLGILQIEATTNQACTAMVCKSSIEAFYLFVTLEGMYRQIDNMTRGSVQQNLSKDLVAEIQIPRIPRQVLEEMGLAEYYAQIAVNMRESDGLASIRDALLPKLMSGEIDVSQIDLPTPPNSHLPAHR